MRSVTSALYLYGRQTHRRGHRWQYYVADPSGDLVIPLTFKGKDCDAALGCEELYDGDKVTIDALQGVYRLRVYKTPPLRYDPDA